MAKYNVYLVKTVHVMPVAADSIESAKQTVSDLFGEHLHMHCEMGFDDMETVKFTARKVNSEKEIPVGWRGTDLFNQHDVDYVTAKDVFKGYHPDDEYAKNVADFKKKLKFFAKKEGFDIFELKGIVGNMT